MGQNRIVVEVRQFDQYVVKVDGSGRMTLRNRKFLRKYTPVATPAARHTIIENILHHARRGNMTATSPTMLLTPPAPKHEAVRDDYRPDKLSATPGTLPATSHPSGPPSGRAGHCGAPGGYHPAIRSKDSCSLTTYPTAEPGPSITESIGPCTREPEICLTRVVHPVQALKLG